MDIAGQIQQWAELVGERYDGALDEESVDRAVTVSWRMQIVDMVRAAVREAGGAADPADLDAFRGSTAASEVL